MKQFLKYTIISIFFISCSAVKDISTTTNYEMTFVSANPDSSGKYKVELLLKNLTTDKLIFIKPEKVTLFDKSGQNYVCSEIILGNSKLKYDSYWGKCITNTLYSNVPAKLSLYFDTAEDIEYISTCAIELILEKKSLDAPKITLKVNDISTRK